MAANRPAADDPHPIPSGISFTMRSAREQWGGRSPRAGVRRYRARGCLPAARTAPHPFPCTEWRIPPPVPLPPQDRSPKPLPRHQSPSPGLPTWPASEAADGPAADSIAAWPAAALMPFRPSWPRAQPRGSPPPKPHCAAAVRSAAACRQSRPRAATCRDESRWCNRHP